MYAHRQTLHMQIKHMMERWSHNNGKTMYFLMHWNVNAQALGHVLYYVHCQKRPIPPLSMYCNAHTYMRVNASALFSGELMTAHVAGCWLLTALSIMIASKLSRHSSTKEPREDTRQEVCTIMQSIKLRL
jgi:hypothetical protein